MKQAKKHKEERTEHLLNILISSMQLMKIMN